MFASAYRGRVAGVAAGYLADVLFGDPRRGHPVALFGGGAVALEQLSYADSRRAGAVHAGVLLGALGVVGIATQQAARRRGQAGTAAVTAAATFVALGGTSLSRTGRQMAGLLRSGDVAAEVRRMDVEVQHVWRGLLDLEAPADAAKRLPQQHGHRALARF